MMKKVAGLNRPALFLLAKKGQQIGNSDLYSHPQSPLAKGMNKKPFVHPLRDSLTPADSRLRPLLGAFRTSGAVPSGLFSHPMPNRETIRASPRLRIASPLQRYALRRIALRARLADSFTLFDTAILTLLIERNVLYLHFCNCGLLKEEPEKRNDK